MGAFSWTCGLLLLASGPLLAASAARPDPLATEERLARPLNIALREEPLADFLAQVQRETGVALEAAEETADERVTLFARGRPARELLERVAEHLDYTWVRESRNGSPAYRLTQELAARERELALRGDHEADFRELREPLERTVRILESPEGQQAVRKPYPRRFARIRALNERLTGERVWVRKADGSTRTERRPAPVLAPAERGAVEQELRVLRAVTPGSYGFFDGEESAAWLYLGLPPAARSALWRGEPLRFAFPTDPIRLPLLPETVTALGHGTLGTLETNVDEITGRESQAPLRAVERLRAELKLDLQGGTQRLQVRVRVLGTYGEQAPGHRAEWVFTEQLDHPKEPPELPGSPLDPAVQALRDPITLRARPVPPGGSPRTDFVDLLEQISAQVPYPVLADGYLAVMQRSVTAERRPLPEVLREPCRTFDRLCRMDRGYLTVRSLDWATARALEPPARSVRSWEREWEERGALSWPTLAAIAEQCPAGNLDLLRYRWSSRVPEGLHVQLAREIEQSGELLRLLASLSGGARRSLETGRALPLQPLPAVSQRRAREVLARAADEYHGYEDFALPGAQPFAPGTGFLEEDRQAAAWDRATLSLRRKPASWIIARQGFLPVEQLERALADERARNPLATEKDLKRIEGERVEFTLTLPGANPIVHYFLVPSTRLAGSGAAGARSYPGT